MPVTQALIDEALAALRATEVRSLTAGGQETVSLVERAGVELVMRVIAVSPGRPMLCAARTARSNS